MWLKIKRGKRNGLSVPCLATLLSWAKGRGWGEGATIEDALLGPALCWRRVQPWGQFVQSQVCKNVAAPRCRAARSPPRLSCLPVVPAAGKCFSSDRFQSCHSVIPCVTRQKTPPRPPSPAHLFPCALSPCSRSLTAFQGNHRRCNRSSGIYFFFLFPRCLITLITLF